MSTPRPVVQNDDYMVRLPRQRRSQESWARMLDAGLALIEEGGYEAFTISALCELAGVLPRAIYERVDTKEALFMAVYEHGMSQVWATSQSLHEEAMTSTRPAPLHIRLLVEHVATVFDHHQGILRPILLMAPHHPEIYRRGRKYSRLQAANFVAAMRRIEGDISHRNREEAMQFGFEMVFSAVVFRTMYGPGFVTPAMTQPDFVKSLAGAVEHYLLDGHRR